MDNNDHALSRRRLLIATGQSVIAGSAAARLRHATAATPPAKPRFTIWDAHGHLTTPGDSPAHRIDYVLRVADRMGIDRVVVFMGYPWSYAPSPGDMRRQNDQVMQAVEHNQDRVFGFVYLNPNHTDASLQELDRCVRDGPMVGVKLWVAVHCNAPSLDSIVARATQLKAPVLQHTWRKITGNLPGESTATDLAELASRHPQATLIAAHSGGDWERGIRALRRVPNVLAEICGSDPTAGFVEMAVRELGANRVVYGSDYAGRSFASQLAKVLGADVPNAAKQLILSGNLRRVLKPICDAKGLQI